MNAFCWGEELASLVVSSGLLNHSWNTILDCYDHADGPDSVGIRVTNQGNGAIIVAFTIWRDWTLRLLQTAGCDLISSEALRSSQTPFDFICTKINPSFCIHRAAIELFASILHRLPLLKDQLCGAGATKLIITGHALGGSVASLFTLWLLDSLPLKDNKRPLCITFGSPLLGDRGFQRAISERPSWNPCFLNVVYNQDPIPRSFIFQQTHIYEPFGTFLLGSDLNYSCIEEPELATLKSIMAMSSGFAQSQYPSNGFQFIDYRLILGCIDSKIMSQGTVLPGNLYATTLQAGIILQLEAIGVDKQDSNFSSLARSMEKSLMRSLKRSTFDPSKKLSAIKLDMTCLEWYKKSTVEGGGYYDSFKNVDSQSGEKIKSRQEINKHKKILDKYWKRMVEEVEKMPQKEGVAFCIRWLYAGTNYRRMVEPLDIAEYYMSGKKDYRKGGRSDHYILLEKWMNEDKVGGSANTRNKAVSLTEDSCFWAYVEEAIICCRVLGDQQSSTEKKALSRECLVGFEEYVMDSVRRYSVSPEIFLNGSTFREWWIQYQKIIDPSYTSSLTLFMANEGYRNYVNDDEYRTYV